MAPVAEALCKVGDRVRVEGTQVVHLRTGRKVSLEAGASVSTLARVRLKGLKELPGETIELAKQAEPAVAGAFRFTNVAAAAGREEILAELAALPTSKSQQDHAARNLMFACKLLRMG